MSGKQNGEVKISYLNEEELASYRKKTEKTVKRKPKRIVDWRWPQNRK